MLLRALRCLRRLLFTYLRSKKFPLRPTLTRYLVLLMKSTRVLVVLL